MRRCSAIRPSFSRSWSTSRPTPHRRWTGTAPSAIALDTVELAGDLALSHGSSAAGRYARLTVSDAGRGIDAATAERIVRALLHHQGGRQRHGARPVDRSRHRRRPWRRPQRAEPPGRGQHLRGLPRPHGRRRPRAPLRRAAPAPSGRGETVLLVDDETPLVLLGEEMLAALGYEPVGFEAAPTALAAFRADPDRFDLVLTDEIMPGMTGTELAVALHRLGRSCRSS